MRIAFSCWGYIGVCRLYVQEWDDWIPLHVTESPCRRIKTGDFFLLLGANPFLLLLCLESLSAKEVTPARPSTYPCLGDADGR